MATLGQIVRFTGGMAMIAGGGVLVAPVASEIVQRLQSPPAATVVAAEAAPLTMPTPATHAIPDTLPMAPADVPALQAASADPLPRAADPYQPPAPPAPLPASFPGFVPAATGLNSTYRSTVRVPPPPLLDAHGPPPVAPGWTTREPPRPAAGPASRGDVPTTYMVRDGDDLTALAIRFYGHPGAAAAILDANRDVLVRPDMLPIGVAIRLPPPWTVGTGAVAGGLPTIEPGPASDRGNAAGRGRPGERAVSPFSPVSAPRPWLDAAGT
jgi:nucleoid-associated protein YgaU